MRVAIHQPNFMPWMPFFEKMQKCDLFIFLTDCQFEKGGYQNRFWLNGRWHTMSVNKHPLNKKIWETGYVDPVNDWDRIKRHLPHYGEIWDCIGEGIQPEMNLAQYNIKLIENILKLLEWNLKPIRDMDFCSTKGMSGTERLIRLCMKVNATEYLSGIGARKYLDEDLFNHHGIKVIWQEIKSREHSLDVIRQGNLIH
jgi:hypothetical protein